MYTIGHHTCRKDDGGRDDVLRNAPYLAIHNPEPNTPNEPTMQFLGTGYYFWDNDIEQAKYWGESHYSNSYYVLRADIHVRGDLLLDIVGRREDMMKLERLMEAFKDMEIVKRRAGEIATIIEVSREMENRKKGIFPYQVIRAEDMHAKLGWQPKNKFVKEKSAYTKLHPRYIICIVKKCETLFSGLQIVHES